ncbi:MAG: chromate transporter [Sphaerochaetaceae bacterium]|nr:chromate transporter [Sphaerochaetaceae bacterium]MDD3163008.1 chromate transporter [Sphaerochaetaceae bacterium]MDD4007268.1 chromate transporter [Sphaerochaetaceae bacterium]MDD4396200.1 chromate transporter [Sphaerochaetaceae bacterium]
MSATLWQLFSSFCKIGALTFGGGMAMLPMLEKEVVERHGWASEDELLDFYALGQCTPGIIAVNTATFVGYKQRKDIGGIIATLGVVFPSFVIILLLATVLNAFEGNVYLLKAFSGIRIAVCALILKSVISMARKSVTDIASIFAIIIAIAVNLVLGVSTAFVVLGAIVAGVIYHLVMNRIRMKKEKGSV